MRSCTTRNADVQTASSGYRDMLVFAGVQTPSERSLTVSRSRRSPTSLPRTRATVRGADRDSTSAALAWVPVVHVLGR